jgi:putative peptidoglycan lipid II flippase
MRAAIPGRRRYAMISIAVNIVGNLILIPLIGHVGPPLATALASTVNVAMLYRTLVERGHFAADSALRRKVPRLLLAALLMGATVFAFERLLTPYLGGALIVRYAALGVLVGAGSAVYGVACFVTGAYRIADLKALMRRRGTSNTPKPAQE